jgi:putative ABC transport system ATP-binding protein
LNQGTEGFVNWQVKLGLEVVDMEQPLVELTNIYLQNDRGGYVFEDLSLTIEAGQSIMVVGAAGSGKSSLVELLVGLRFAERGSVEAFGHLLARGRNRRIRAVRNKIGGVGGTFGLLPGLTVAENISLPLIIAGIRKRQQGERLLAALTEFSLLNQASEYPHRLTRVEKTLVQFARASVANQPLIIIDEPLAGLDQKTFRRIHEYLVRIALSGRSMLILASEDIPREIPQCRKQELISGALV